MKLTFLIIWLSVPVGWAAWHYGPGQDALKRDRADKALAGAKGRVSEKDHTAAIEAYDATLAALPKEEVAQARRIRLARAQALMDGHRLPEGHTELKGLFEELLADPTADQDVMNGTREALANAKYHLTWLMRLEGHPREVWEPEIESARQHFRHLAELDGESAKTADRERYQVNLESSIRLARMDLAELQGLPLPSR